MVKHATPDRAAAVSGAKLGASRCPTTAAQEERSHKSSRGYVMLGCQGLVERTSSSQHPVMDAMLLWTGCWERLICECHMGATGT